MELYAFSFIPSDGAKRMSRYRYGNSIYTVEEQGKKDALFKHPTASGWCTSNLTQGQGIENAGRKLSPLHCHCCGAPFRGLPDPDYDMGLAWGPCCVDARAKAEELEQRQGAAASAFFDRMRASPQS